MSDSQHREMGEISRLPARERAVRYRQLADRHVRLAARTQTPEAKEAHLQLAALWARLSGQAERQANVEDGHGADWPGAGAPGEAPPADDGSGSSA